MPCAEIAWIALFNRTGLVVCVHVIRLVQWLVTVEWSLFARRCSHVRNSRTHEDDLGCNRSLGPSTLRRTADD